MTGWKRSAILAAVLLVAACASQDDNTPDTPETRCQRICTASANGPCAGQSDPSCQSTCVARLTGKSEECQSCLHGHSGWKGVSCSCDEVLGGFGSVTCKTCKWTGANNTCTTEVTGSCSVTPSCEGLVIAPVGEPDCASACGEASSVDAGV